MYIYSFEYGHFWEVNLFWHSFFGQFFQFLGSFKMPEMHPSQIDPWCLKCKENGSIEKLPTMALGSKVHT